jgi:N12 class adenine-specific DNA methylase
MIQHTPEYQLIAAHYGTDAANRSQVPLINHIDQGLAVLRAIGSTDAAMRAFCLHPLLQNDRDLLQNYTAVAAVASARAVLLAMEYRHVANAFLSYKIAADSDLAIQLSPLGEVNDMLTADKVQNYKDFQRCHKATHPHSEQLDQYFGKWLTALDIDDETYDILCRVIDGKSS